MDTHVVISVANQKGGVGKTTTALTLAHLLQLEGENVAVIDLDAPGPNREIGAAAAERKASTIGIPAYTIATLPEELPEYILIDCPPDAANEDFRVALSLSDFIVVPSSPSMDDLEVAIAFASRMDGKAYSILLTKTYHSGSEADTLKRWLRQEGYKVLESEVTEYAVYKEAALRGTTVAGLELAPARKAARDYLGVLHELRRLTRG